MRSTPTRLFAAGAAALLAAAIYFALHSHADDPLHLHLGIAILLAAALPALLWAKRGDYRFPIFEVFMLTGVNTYAIPLLSGHQYVEMFANDDVTLAAMGVLLFQVVAIVVYLGTSARPKTGRGWKEEVIAKGVASYLEYGMMLTTAYSAAVLLTDWIPFDVQGILRAVCFGVGIMATFILSRWWGQGQLRHQQKVMFALLLVLQVLLSWAGLFLISGLSTLVLAFLGYVTGARRLPLVAIAVTVVVVAALHTGKSAMRVKYWDEGAPRPTAAELPSFYLEWISHSFDAENVQSKEQTTRLLERTSLMHILCMVVTYTPSRQPFLEGRTYAQIPGQFVPRFFWHDKPVGHVSTNTLSIYYGLQSAEGTEKTTIAFGLLSEAYANFGFIGMAVIGAVFAFCFRKISGWAAQSPILSYAGLFQIVLMAWSFQSELTLSVWLSSLWQACVAVLGIPFVVRNLLGR